MKINSGNIFACVPHAMPELVNSFIMNWQIVEDGGIVSAADTAMFLGNVAVETAGLTRLEENLFYTSASRLRTVWPSRFPSNAIAEMFVRNPQGLAEKVYGGRFGNVNPGDGWAYRGSGALQTTFLDNFQEVANETGIDVVADPDLLRSMPHALKAAVIYWRKHGLLGMTDIAAACRKIQGGNGGLTDRVIYVTRFRKELIDTAPTKFKVIRRGDKGKPVVEIQTILTAAACYGGKLDGDFGPGTENAVRDFQQEHGLNPVDGVIGAMTYSALKQWSEQRE